MQDEKFEVSYIFLVNRINLVLLRGNAPIEEWERLFGL
jgi:hypothetical protein